MLETLHVKNLAIIDESEVTFAPGLNILTGETGAGKSVIIGSVNLALGGKADRDFLRKNADFGLVELTFSVTEEKQREALKRLDVYPEEDRVILSRKITDSRNICKVNGETVTTSLLKEIAGVLIDVHGQHENSALLSAKNHLKILDQYGGEGLRAEFENYAQAYEVYVALKKEYEAFLEESQNADKEIDFLRFEIAEIEGANLYV